jgi:hemerythrin HHE cation binding domain-containing protein
MTETVDVSHGDVVDFLIEQHREVRRLLDQVLATGGPSRQETFDVARAMLARHETAEEMVVRPLTRKMPGGEEIAQGRMDEENQAKKDLAELEKLDISSEEFVSAFTTFRSAVLNHAGAEEQLEFRALRDGTDAQTLASAQDKLQKAERAAPSHPHPSAKTTAMNYVAGPFASMLDRARDALSGRP